MDLQQASFVWALVCFVSLILGVIGAILGLSHRCNKHRTSGNRLFDAGVASAFGAVVSAVFPPLGIVAGSLAIAWRHDG